MKLNKLLLTAVVAASMTSFAHAADQGHGTVTFTGSIIDAPCSITPETIDQVVHLGQISNVILKDGGSSNPKPFEIKLENCTLDTMKSVTTTFTGSPGANGLLGITGTAKGASIAITNGSGVIVTLGQATPAQLLQDGNNTLSFSAYLKGDGTAVPIVPGEFKGVADFTLAYQ